MIESSEDKIKIYSNTNIIRLKKDIKQKNIQVLEAEITKEGIKFYKKKQVFEYTYSDLKEVFYDSSYNSRNEVFISYYNDNKKLKTKIFNITGCDKVKFVDMVNNIRQYDKETINIISDNNKNEENINEKENLYKKLKNGETLKVLFLGKDRLLKRISKDSYSLPTSSKFYFIDENGNELYLYLPEMDIDYNELKIEKVYTIEFNKKYILKCVEQDFNKQIFENAKNKLEHKFTLLFDDIKIHKEIEYEQKIYKVANIFKYILLLDLLLLFKHTEISIMIFFAVLIINLIFLCIIRERLKDKILWN